MRTIIALLCLGLAACSDDPARAVKIVERPAPVTSQYIPPAGPDHDLLPEFCPPPPGEPGPSTFVVTGPCAFAQRAPVDCESSVDDFIVAIPRPAKKDATVVVYINVESYHGPGAYDGVQFFVAAENGTNLYRWSSENAHATVGAGEAFIVLRKTELKLEGMRFGCNKLIGPDSNYTYQCAATSNAPDGPEVASGKLQCRAH